MTELLAIRGVTVGYGEGTVLTDVDLTIPAAGAVCVLGRNGVGKTTLVKTIMGLIRPRRGELTFDGKDLSQLAPHARARLGIGYVPQGRLIFPQLSVLENLQIGMQAADGRADGLVDVYDLFPLLREMRNRQAGMLSGGQQQQLAIGRALVSRPRLLILDEPTEGIQPSIVLELRRALREVRARMHVALLLAEQFVDFAAGLADDWCVIDGGTIALRERADTIDHQAVRELLAV